MALLDLQRQFCAELRTGQGDIQSHVRADADVGLAVYRHAYQAQLKACLRDTYEKLWAWLGDDAFEAAAAAYVEGHPPVSWTLNDYGDRFADMLETFFGDDAEVADLARLDWALRRAFEAPDAAPLDPLSLAEVDWDRARLILAPSLRVFAVTTNCGLIWNAIAREETPPAAERLPGAAAIRVWRRGLAPHFCTITADEQHALALAGAGIGFSDLCAEIARDLNPDAAAAQVGQWLAGWIQDEVVVGVV